MGGSLILKMFYNNGIGFNGAKISGGIVHILGVLLMNSYDSNTYFEPQQLICRPFFLNYHIINSNQKQFLHR